MICVRLHRHSIWRHFGTLSNARFFSCRVDAVCTPVFSEKTRSSLYIIPVANQASRVPRTRTIMTGRKTALDESSDGEFKRTDSTFRNWVKADGSSDFPAVAGRYTLIISYACPWACRCLMMRAFKGLEDVISLSVVSAAWEESERMGRKHWVFRSPEEVQGCIPFRDCQSLADVYAIENPDYDGKVTVPVLFDNETNRIVNNESAEIIRMFNSEFNHLAKKPELDFYPESVRAKIDEINEKVYHTVNNGVYRAGFATKQHPYEVAVKEVFESLDWLEHLLSGSRYLVGETLTEADIRLFTTIIRFDEVYAVHFKCNRKLIREYSAILGWAREIYQMPGIEKTVNMWHIKHHYYESHTSINPYAIVPVGSDWSSIFSQPHGRDQI